MNFPRLKLLAFILLGALAGGLAARAQEIDLSGNVGWEKHGTRIRIHAGFIDNYRLAGSSGFLRLQVYATANVYDGTNAITGYVLGTYNLGPLAAGAALTNRSRLVRYVPPPPGLYYTTITLEENTTEGFVVADSVNFDGLVNLGGFGEGGANLASAGDISFAGDVSWSASNKRVQFFAEQIRNERVSGRSGTLRVRLFASDAPYGGGTNTLAGFPMAMQRVGRVFAQSQIQFYPRQTSFRVPPPGDYSVVMTLEEYDHGWVIVDYVNFDGTSLF